MGAQFDLNALSGINASAKGLGVIANNLANAETVGFKGSRAEFGDLFSGVQSTPGNGVRVANITQDFQQGTISETGRELDMAIDGEGFFVLEDRTGKYESVYTRNGSFKLDESGYLTTQNGDKVQGYLLDEKQSTETNPVFSTGLSAIDLDELNRTPQPTDEMVYDINLNGQLSNNLDPILDPAQAGNNVSDDSIGSVVNLSKLMNPTVNGEFQGSADFYYPKTVYDSLGGEHTMNISFYKRDVVDAYTYNTDGTVDAELSQIDENGDDIAVTGNPPVKYTSWIVQFNVTNEDGDYSGHLINPTTNEKVVDANENRITGQIYEVRFDTNGQYLGAWEPPGGYEAGAVQSGIVDLADPANSDVGTLTGAEDGNTTDVAPNSGTPGLATDFGTLGWARVSNPSLSFGIDNPVTGATDPLGAVIPGTEADPRYNIDVDLSDMTQFAGSTNLRGVSQNGFSIGDLIGINTGADGVIEARYSNGRSIAVAQLAIANFTDKNGMEKLGGQMYAETYGSGPVQLGRPEENGYGAINSTALEYSNVDTASELVHMIQTQRTYQASAQVITTSQTLIQRVLQL